MCVMARGQTVRARKRQRGLRVKSAKGTARSRISFAAGPTAEEVVQLILADMKGEKKLKKPRVSKVPKVPKVPKLQKDDKPPKEKKTEKIVKEGKNITETEVQGTDIE